MGVTSTNITEFWLDLSSKNIRPKGWSSVRDIPMKLPPSVASLNFDINFTNVNNEFERLESVPEEVFCEKTRKMFARIQKDNLLEVNFICFVFFFYVNE